MKSDKLTKHAEWIDRPENHLKFLLKDIKRLDKFSLNGGGLFFDFSRQRICKETMDLLFEFADKKKIKKRFEDMVSGKKVNITEDKPALHTALRDFSEMPLVIDGVDVMQEIRSVRNEIRAFSEKIRSGKLTGSTGKPFQKIVVIGIGGSYLGTMFASNALRMYADESMDIDYLSNVDIHDFGRIASMINPETTLWIVISKSYTTSETMANENMVKSYLKEKKLDPSKHFIAVTSKGSPGDNPGESGLKVFHMFDFVGGRYSVTSAVGGVPLSIYLGYAYFERFLKGAHEIDIHTLNASVEENLPLIAALISIWNTRYLGYPAQAIVPYASPLSKLAPHIQQLHMESNGKTTTMNGELLSAPAGAVIFGEPGTNAQHSFFQLAHQGPPFPIDFIGVVKPYYEKYRNKSKGVTNHQELWANLISQPAALAEGKEDPDYSKYFPGNRPSSTLLIEEISPENIGRLLAFYEAKTVFEGFLWDINPFDQFGVELGKTMAKDVRREMAEKNENPEYGFDKSDEISKFYLETLFKGKLKLFKSKIEEANT